MATDAKLARFRRDMAKLDKNKKDP
ncbi:MAG: hypothetical protein RLZ61_1169, partial [Planctomycetota bacterium]